MNCLLTIFLPSQISNITHNIATIHFKIKNVSFPMWRKYPIAHAPADVALVRCARKNIR